jgi:glycosyltransferase involved in cell wall biosynthesis
VALLKSAGVATRSVIVGDGVMRKEWEGLSRELRVEDRIHFAGNHADVERFYPEADVFVLPSTYEGFGNVYPEAFASGLPCIALRRHEPDIRVASDEIIEHGRTGLIVDGNSPERLAEAMKRLQQDPGTLRQWGRNAREAAETRFSWDTTVDRLLALSSMRPAVKSTT